MVRPGSADVPTGPNPFDSGLLWCGARDAADMWVCLHFSCMRWCLCSSSSDGLCEHSVQQILCLYYLLLVTLSPPHCRKQQWCTGTRGAGSAPAGPVCCALACVGWGGVRLLFSLGCCRVTAAATVRAAGDVRSAASCCAHVQPAAAHCLLLLCWWWWWLACVWCCNSCYCS